MKLAIASGKGGTGKTTVATNLAWVAARRGRSVAYVDCDVEEPNGHIFLRPKLTDRRGFGAAVPRVDLDRCTHCGKCGEICQYSAIVSMGEQVLTFPELCHGCGGCWLVCPTQAIAEDSRRAGTVELGSADGVAFAHGILNVGEAMSPPLIRAVKQAAPAAELTIFDAPPGTSCPVVETVRGCDYVLLVTEPTPFGLHDLDLAVKMVRAVGLPFGVVVNRADLDESAGRAYCRASHAPVLAEIRDDVDIARAYSRGRLACRDVPGLRAVFEELLEKVLQ